MHYPPFSSQIHSIIAQFSLFYVRFSSNKLTSSLAGTWKKGFRYEMPAERLKLKSCPTTSNEQMILWDNDNPYTKGTLQIILHTKLLTLACLFSFHSLLLFLVHTCLIQNTGIWLDASNPFPAYHKQKTSYTQGRILQEIKETEMDTIASFHRSFNYVSLESTWMSTNRGVTHHLDRRRMLASSSCLVDSSHVPEFLYPVQRKQAKRFMRHGKISENCKLSNFGS